MAGVTVLAEMFLKWEGCEQKAGDSALLVEKAHSRQAKEIRGAVASQHFGNSHSLAWLGAFLLYEAGCL